MNDALVASSNVSGFAPAFGAGGVNIADEGNGNNSYTKGTIDDVRVYNRALSASEIMWLPYLAF